MGSNRVNQLTTSFSKLWAGLFSSTVHLDSSLSRQAQPLKSILAQVVPPILQRPTSLAEALGVGIAPGEPWSCSQEQLGGWRPALLMAERLYARMNMGVLLAHPVIDDFSPKMIGEWTATWGAEKAAELVEILGREAPLTLRAVRKIGADGLITELTAKHRLPVRAEASHISPLGVRLSGYAPVLNTECFKLGNFEIQDEGSQIMAYFCIWPELFRHMLKANPGKIHLSAAHNHPIILPNDPPAWTIIDACAGAGGKTLALADALCGKGRVYAYDRSEGKLKALKLRAKRAGITNVQAVTVDEEKEKEMIKTFRSRANVVLVDAPCSGWGVLRRNPDIKWRQTDDTLQRLPQIQSELLNNYSKLVAAKGRLVYGVCTFREAETAAVVKKFLETHQEFEAEAGGFLGPGTSDGFFIQSFIRSGR